MPDDKRVKGEAERKGLANSSLNSSRRSGTREDGIGNPVRKGGERDSTESAKVPDQQTPKS